MSTFYIVLGSIVYTIVTFVVVGGFIYWRSTRDWPVVEIY